MFEIRNGAERVGADRDASVASIQQSTGKRLVWVRPAGTQGFFALENDARLSAYEHRRDLHAMTGETVPLTIWKAS